MNPIFVKAGSEHLPSLAEMNKRLIEDEGHSNPMNVPQLAERMRVWLAGEYTAYLICLEDQICGYCLFKDNQTHIYIRHLYVERDQRRKGLGLACLQWLKSQLWAGRKLRVEVLLNNQAGLAFWRSVGFIDYCVTMEMPPSV